MGNKQAWGPNRDPEKDSSGSSFNCPGSPSAVPAQPGEAGPGHPQLLPLNLSKGCREGGPAPLPPKVKPPSHVRLGSHAAMVHGAWCTVPCAWIITGGLFLKS